MSAVEVETGGSRGFPDRIRLQHDPMNEDEAREVTRRIAFYGARLSQEIVSAHDGQAHAALGFATWADYCKACFGMTPQRAGQLILHARKMQALSEVVGIDPDAVSIPEGRTRGMDLDEAIRLLSDAVRELPEDAPIATRGDLISAVTSQLRSAAKSSTMETVVSTKPSAGAQDPAPVAPVEPPAANDDAIAPVVDTVRAEGPEGDAATAGASPLVPGADSPLDATHEGAGDDGAAPVGDAGSHPGDGADSHDVGQAASEPAQAGSAPVHPPVAGAGSAIPPTAGAVAAKVRTWRAVADSSTSAAVLAKNLREACDLIDRLTKDGAA